MPLNLLINAKEQRFESKRTIGNLGNTQQPEKKKEGYKLKNHVKDSKTTTAEQKTLLNASWH
jgi:hypothetical protein